MASTRKTIEYKSITQQQALRLNDRVFVHQDSFNTNPTYNTAVSLISSPLKAGQAPPPRTGASFNLNNNTAGRTLTQTLIKFGLGRIG
jgi:hypothetical protein